MQIPAKADYGIRALLTLAKSNCSLSAEHLAAEQGLPPRFLGAILSDLRRAGLVVSQRGSEGGYQLARPASEISIADALRAISGPMASVRGLRPETIAYDGAATSLRDVWVAVRASLRNLLEHVSLEQVAAGALPGIVTKLTKDPDAWQAR
ncbi:MAG TPA: Rrf2 family transcriptional regulator [Acidimicrobiales bacterium]|nr:Rrf2 family transcriptional regulator [Acidimicrobiales bacterium]